ncbi:MAG: FISUMP domain-containing protein, partial [Bacteroidales bacterium]|nr:FISUMP domain-containing protein [Bacteroidales bacterium]
SLNNSRDGYFYNLAAVMNGAASSNAVLSGVQGVCPDGWHVPSGAEWEQLVEYVSSVEADTCGCNDLQIGKALASTRAWHSTGIPRYSDWANYMNARCRTYFELSTNNATGFNAQPTSHTYYHESQGGMVIASFYIYAQTIFHSTTFNKTPGSEFYYQFNIRDSERVEGNASGYGVIDYARDSNKLDGFSVRCLKDN